MDKHTSRQNWHTDCEKELNNQIGREFQASYQYFSLYTYFDRDDIGLEKIAKFFKKMSDEERDHATKLSEYQNKRGGRVELKPITAVNFDFKEKPYEDVKEAFITALNMEKTINTCLLKLHTLSDERKDPQFCDYLESDFLEEQVESANELSKIIAQLNRIGNDNHGIWHFCNEFNI